MKKLNYEKVKVTGDIPSPRFGHTFTMVSNKKAVLFGGAVSIAGKNYHT
jgi:protein phosphatase